MIAVDSMKESNILTMGNDFFMLLHDALELAFKLIGIDKQNKEIELFLKII